MIGNLDNYPLPQGKPPSAEWLRRITQIRFKDISLFKRLRDLHIAGNFYQYKAVNSDYDVKIDDYVIGVDSANGAVTITLPDASSCFDIDKTNLFVAKDVAGQADSNNIIINTNGELIDGAVSKVISASYGSVSLCSNGTNWVII